MFKFVALCVLLVCSQAAPTDKPIESDSTVAADFVATEKSLPHDIEVVSVKTFSADKRDKREDYSVAPSPNDNKRTPALSQPDYQENKPPTFVFPVPVDQIIKHSNASPEIHHSKQVEEEREDDDAEPTVKENVEAANEEEETEQQPKPKHVHHKHTFKAHSQSDDESDGNQEN